MRAGGWLSLLNRYFRWLRGRREREIRVLSLRAQEGDDYTDYTLFKLKHIHISRHRSLLPTTLQPLVSVPHRSHMAEIH